MPRPKLGFTLQLSLDANKNWRPTIVVVAPLYRRAVTATARCESLSWCPSQIPMLSGDRRSPPAALRSNHARRMRSKGPNYNQFQWQSIGFSIVSGYYTLQPDGLVTENNYKNLTSPRTAPHRKFERRARHVVPARSTRDLCGGNRIYHSSMAQEVLYNQGYTRTREPVFYFWYVSRGSTLLPIPSPCG